MLYIFEKLFTHSLPIKLLRVELNILSILASVTEQYRCILRPKSLSSIVSGSVFGAITTNSSPKVSIMMMPSRLMYSSKKCALNVTSCLALGSFFFLASILNPANNSFAYDVYAATYGV